MRFGFDDEFWNRYPESIRSLSDQEVADAARSVLHPDALTWIVVGDRAAVQADILELGFGNIHMIDADGMAVH